MVPPAGTEYGRVTEMRAIAVLGVAPAPPAYRPSCVGHPARLWNRLAGKGLCDGDCFSPEATRSGESIRKHQEQYDDSCH